MSFVTFSSGHVIDNTTSLSNVFIEEYIACNGDCVRVYLYGLYLCGSSTRYDNTLEHFAKALGLGEADIMDAFTYWQEMGLVQILSVKPVQIKYLPVAAGAARLKKYSKDKYSDFNAQIQAIIDGRMVTPNEFQEYYAFMESFHVEPAALIMITKYCIDLKGSNVGYNYILTVAKNWAYAGIKTAAQVEEKFAVQEYDATTIAKILKDLGSKRRAEPADYHYLEQWRLKGYDDETLFAIATFCHKIAHRKIADMDVIIEKFYKRGLTTPASIDTYIGEKVNRDKAIKELIKSLGISREVCQIDRDFYATWVDTWNFAPDIIAYAATLAVDKSSPMAYLNKVLSSWYDKKITTLDAAKSANYTAPTVNITRHSYTDKELKNIFANIEEVDF